MRPGNLVPHAHVVCVYVSVCEPARGHTQLMEPNNVDVFIWTDKFSKIKYFSSNESTYQVDNSPLFVTLNHEISQRELIDKFLHSLREGFRNHTIDINKMVNDIKFDLKIGGNDMGCLYKGLYKEKVLTNYRDKKLIIFNYYVWKDNRGNSYSSVEDAMYYDIKQDMFATIDRKFTKNKLTNQKLDKYLKALEKGYVAKENHCTGLKRLENKITELKTYDNNSLYAKPTDVFLSSQGKPLIVFSHEGNHKDIAKLVHQKKFKHIDKQKKKKSK